MGVIAIHLPRRFWDASDAERLNLNDLTIHTKEKFSTVAGRLRNLLQFNCNRPARAPDVRESCRMGGPSHRDF